MLHVLEMGPQPAPFPRFALFALGPLSPCLWGGKPQLELVMDKSRLLSHAQRETPYTIGPLSWSRAWIKHVPGDPKEVSTVRNVVFVIRIWAQSLIDLYGTMKQLKCTELEGSGATHYTKCSCARSYEIGRNCDLVQHWNKSVQDRWQRE